MEVVIAYDESGEAGRGEFDKAGVYIVADKADLGVFFERELEEKVPEGAMVNGGEDVKDGAEDGIGDVAVEFKSIVAFSGGAPGTGRAFEHIDADCLGKADLPIPDEFLYHGKDDVASGEGVHNDIINGSDGPVEPGATGKENVGGDAEAGIDKVRADGKGSAAVLARKALGAEGAEDAGVRVGGVSDGDGPVLAIGDGMATVAGRAGRVRGHGVRDEKLDGVVMSDGLGNVDFRGQAGKGVGDI